MKNKNNLRLAAMRRQAVNQMKCLRNRATLCINLGDRCMLLDRAHGIEWVLTNVLTPQQPRRRAGKKGKL